MKKGESMHRRTTLLLMLLIVSCVPSLASQPGQPLDCSDMVFPVPGFSCTAFVPIGVIPPLSPESYDLWWRGSNVAVDNEGALLFVRQIGVSGSIEIRSQAATGETLLATIAARSSPYGWDGILPRGACSTNNCGNQAYVGAAVNFDPSSGRLLVWFTSRSDVPGCGGCHEDHPWIAAITGFPPLFEILQTYTPAADALQFRVP